MPTSYRVDFFNLLVNEFGHDVKFCFIREPGFDYKKSISVFENESFINNSKFYNEDDNIFWIFEFILDLIKDRPQAIINGGMSPRALLLSLFCKIFRRKLFIWWGGTYLSNRNISYSKRVFRKIIALLANGGVFYSQLAYDYYARLTNRPSPYVILGNNTRDSLKYHKEVVLRKSLAGSRQNVKFLTVGFLSETKNIIAVLEAFRFAAPNLPEVELIIAGDGPERPALEKFCINNKLHNISFLGHVNPSELLAIYANCDVYVHPSRRDQWPQTFNEAAAAGLPILVSENSGVYNEYTTKYKDIVLFDPNNFIQLAERIESMAKNKKLRDELGKSALSEALKHDAQYACSQVIKLANA